MSGTGQISSNIPAGTTTPRSSTSGSNSNQAAASPPNFSTSNTSPLTSSTSSAVSLHSSLRSALPRTNSNVIAAPSVNQTASSARAQSQNRSSILDKINHVLSRPAVHSLLHSTGLKTLSYKKKYKGTNGQEVPKPVLLKSWVLALCSLSNHVLPTIITVFLITFNAKVMVNGPPTSVPATYVLQGASKLHELTIAASLARVITDILRYQLLNDSVDFGMLCTPFSFVGLNYLWSQEFISSVRSAYRLKAKAHISLIAILAIFSLLATVAGPASALLFLPSTAWLSAGSTSIFLIGNDNDLWPQHLTERHAAGDGCASGDPGKYWCPHGGWDYLQGFIAPEGVSRRVVSISDAWTPRYMWLWRDAGGNGSDSWASASHGASTYLAERLTDDHQHAWGFAHGKQRRIRDATVAGTYNRFTGPIPVVRVVCAPVRTVNRTSPTLLYPILDPDRPWRLSDTPGPTKEVKVEGTHEKLVNITLHSLPADFGSTTGAMSFVTNNASTTAGCGCSFDARWAQGVTERQGESDYWQSFVVDATLPKALQFRGPQRLSFFAPDINEYLGPPITSDTSWLHRLSTGYQLKDSTGNFTPLEVILISTRLWDLPWTIGDPVNPIFELEAVLSVYLVNALSRVGWDPQRDPNSQSVNPLLRMGNRSSDSLLHQNGQVWERPTNVSIQALPQEWFAYATAWQLGDPALYISIGILGTHLFVVVLHSAFVLWKGQWSEAWNYISELIALAYVSEPVDGALKNCGSAIMLQKSLRQRVRVVAEENQGVHQVRLVPCDHKEIRTSDAILVVDREYG
ncbi:hypothetical protein DE146DRAFT_214255 [Phaeosphaeria sp. MPI-PUGE-AT-0046c]|nr:hypothetical protein DE146DRAFT_214255 [Phaeosphaeria sp. MPI-PUGE-AT-0046c]